MPERDNRNRPRETTCDPETSNAETRAESPSLSRVEPGARLLGWHASRPRPVRPAAPSEDEEQARRLRAEGLRLASSSGPFEWADIAWDLCDRGRPNAAAAFWTAVLELYDCDARVHLHLADCLSEARRPERALQVALRGYRLEPELFEFQEAVLDLLFALGRDEHSVDWTPPAPSVVRLGERTRRRIARHLSENGECDLFDLRFTLFDDEYLCFDVEDLARDLEADESFDVCRFEGAAYATLVAPYDAADPPADRPIDARITGPPGRSGAR